jgi:hypothetical protein
LPPVIILLPHVTPCCAVSYSHTNIYMLLHHIY